MSFDANVEELWKKAKTAKNGIPYLRYDDLPEGSYIKSQLSLKNGSSITIDGFNYVLSIYNGQTFVFRNPIKSNNSLQHQQQQQEQKQQQQKQPPVVLSLEHIEWIRQAATNSQQTLEVAMQTLEVAKGIEKLLTDSARDKDS